MPELQAIESTQDPINMQGVYAFHVPGVLGRL